MLFSLAIRRTLDSRTFNSLQICLHESPRRNSSNTRAAWLRSGDSRGPRYGGHRPIAFWRRWTVPREVPVSMAISFWDLPASVNRRICASSVIFVHRPKFIGRARMDALPGHSDLSGMDLPAVSASPCGSLCPVCISDSRNDVVQFHRDGRFVEFPLSKARDGSKRLPVWNNPVNRRSSTECHFDEPSAHARGLPKVSTPDASKCVVDPRKCQGRRWFF
jgi:hypothetical protein